MNNNKMKKYLFYFGYNGARFSGVEREKNYGDKDNSVAKYLEDGLSTLSPHNTATIYNSSNIAAGAHAICSTFHTELSLPQIKIYRWSGFKVPYTQEQRITFKMNRFFKEMCLDVRYLDQSTLN